MSTLVIIDALEACLACDLYNIDSITMNTYGDPVITAGDSKYVWDRQEEVLIVLDV